VYIVQNPHLQGWVKVGRCVLRDQRLAAYNTSHPLRGYRMTYSVLTNDCIAGEQAVLDALRADPTLKPSRWDNEMALDVTAEDGPGEWFECSREEARKAKQTHVARVANILYEDHEPRPR
jgi:LPS sulfotransferase NodH